jgi:hypothetical protein
MNFLSVAVYHYNVQLFLYYKQAIKYLPIICIYIITYVLKLKMYVFKLFPHAKFI